MIFLRKVFFAAVAILILINQSHAQPTQSCFSILNDAVSAKNNYLSLKEHVEEYENNGCNKTPTRIVENVEYLRHLLYVQLRDRLEFGIRPNIVTGISSGSVSSHVGISTQPNRIGGGVSASKPTQNFERYKH